FTDYDSIENLKELRGDYGPVSKWESNEPWTKVNDNMWKKEFQYPYTQSYVAKRFHDDKWSWTFGGLSSIKRFDSAKEAGENMYKYIDLQGRDEYFQKADEDQYPVEFP